MSETYYGKDRKPFEQPPAPAYFTGQQVVAFRRGFTYYVGGHRDETLDRVTGADLARRRYQKRGLVQAFLEGWDAAKRLDP